MNIALSSILIIFLLLPSIFFRAFIIRSDSLENPLDTSIKTELGIVFFISIIVHVIGIFLVNKFSSYNFDIVHLYQIILGDPEYVDLQVLRDSFTPFLQYIVIQNHRKINVP